MVRYFAKRIGAIVIVALIISIILFAIFTLIPGDRVEMMIDPSLKSDPVQYQKLYDFYYEKLGLGDPIVIQYFKWLGSMLTGDFGFSTMFKKPVVNVISEPLIASIKLNVVVMITVFLITIPLGIITAVKKNTLLDRGVQTFTAITYSIPTIIVSMILIFIFAIKLEWLPSGGMSTVNFSGNAIAKFFDSAKYMILPVTASTLVALASISRYVRGAMIDVLSQDYVRTARAKGLSEKVVIYSHAFRNALIPVVTIATGWIIGLFSGNIIIESIFNWNGVGGISLTAIRQLDFAIPLTLIMMTVVISLVAYFIMDLVYMLVDPRIRVG